MIAVAVDEIDQIALRPFVEKEVVVPRAFCRRSIVEGFVHDEKAHASQRSRNSGVGGLWLVRMALQPISLSSCKRPGPDAFGNGGPDAPPSPWRQTPLSLTCWPLRRKPLSTSKTAVRMPIGVSYWSTTSSPSAELRSERCRDRDCRGTRVSGWSSSDRWVNCLPWRRGRVRRGCRRRGRLSWPS